MTNKVFSLLNYVGHKSKILDQIMVHFPKTLKGTFWDVFSGSCVVGLSTPYNNIHFVDNNKYLQNLYTNLDNPNFLTELEGMITKYNLTNSLGSPDRNILRIQILGLAHGKEKQFPIFI